MVATKLRTAAALTVTALTAWAVPTGIATASAPTAERIDGYVLRAAVEADRMQFENCMDRLNAGETSLQHCMPQRPSVENSPGAEHAGTQEVHILESSYLDTRLAGAFQAAVVMPGGETRLYADETSSPLEPYRIASVSKLITTTAVMRLAEAGEINLDDQVAPLLPFTARAAWESLTIRDLLQQRSGLPADKDRWFSGRWKSCREAAEEAFDRNPVNRGQYAYSNTNFCALALAVETVTGKPFFEVLQERIFTPLNMTSPQIDERYQHLAGAGDLKVSAVDLAALMTALQDESVNAPSFLTLETKQLMKTRVVWNYGTGTWIFDDGSWGHSGTLSQGRNIVVELVDSGTIVIVMNQSNELSSGRQLLPFAEGLAKRTL